MKILIRILPLLVIAGAARAAVPPAPPPAPDAPLTLHDLVVAALKSNLELNSKRLDPQIQMLEVTAAKGDFDPVFAFGAFSSSSDRPQNEQQFLATGSIARIYQEDLIHYEAGFTGKLPTGASYSISSAQERSDNTFNRDLAANPLFHPEYTSSSTFSLTQPLLRDFGTAASYAEIRLRQSAFTSSKQELRGTVLKVLMDVLNGYYEMAFGQENVKVKEEAVTLAQDLVRENQRRTDEGKMSDLDVTQARERESEASEELLLARNFLDQRRNTLVELTRDNFATDGENWPIDGSQMLREAPPLDRGLLLGEMFEHNPTYLTNVETVKSEGIRLAYAKNQRWPRLDLKSSLSYNGLAGDWGPAFTDYRNRPGPDWNIGMIVNIPITGRTARSRYTEAMSRKRQAIFNVKRSEIQLLSAFDTALRNIGTAQKRVALVHQSVVLAHDSLAAEEKRLASGLTTSYNVASMQKDLSQARSRELATYVDLNKALAQLYALVGTLDDHLHVVIEAR